MPDWLVWLLVGSDVLARVIGLVASNEMADEVADKRKRGYSDSEVEHEEWWARTHGRLFKFGLLFFVGTIVYGLGKEVPKMVVAANEAADFPLLGRGKKEKQPAQLAIAPGEGGELSKVK